MKVNALTDPAIIDELYEASQAGARVELVVRGICSLRPGVKGLSENIHVRSIVGRFLEHSRVYHFDREGEGCWLMGSADLMPRNLDNRLELVVPIENERLRSRLSSVFDALLSDNANAWELDADGAWRRTRRGKGERAKRDARRVDADRLSSASPHRRQAAVTSGVVATIVPMRVGVVDVGSNTVRLLVAARRNRCVEPLLEQRAYLRLGDEIERLGWISDAKLRETVDCVRRYADAADELGVHQLEVVVTAPGRRAANGDELVAALAKGAGANVRVLAAEEEGRARVQGRALVPRSGSPTASPSATAAAARRSWSSARPPGRNGCAPSTSAR